MPDQIKLGEFIPAAPPQPAPQISLDRHDRQPRSRSRDFKGKFLLVNLWATWCEPCLSEMPSLERLQAKLGDRLTVLAISEDRGGAEAVKPFVDKLGLDMVKIYLDPKSAVSQGLRRRAACRPASSIDADGKVLGKVEGAANWDLGRDACGARTNCYAGRQLVKAAR